MSGRPTIRIQAARFWTGATPEHIVETLLPDLAPQFEFQVSDRPQVVLYGSYPGAMPKGRYLKVFVGTECARPLMRECDWAFGVLSDDYVGHPRYMRIRRWGNDWDLVQRERDWASVLRAKTRFCAFVFAHRVPYREAFFRALSRYKPVDSPGQSMNNMPGIDPVPGVQDWGAKVEFLRQYKFVVAFENQSRPGYHTEKLTHAIEADCVPIYWGDPELGRSYNAKRVLNAMDFLPPPRRVLPRLPLHLHSLAYDGRRTLRVRAFGRVNAMLSNLEQRAWARRGFQSLIDEVIRVDRDDEAYLACLREPFLIGNRLPDRAAWIARWREIFAQALRQEGA